MRLTKEVIMKHLLSFLLFLSTFSFTSAQSNHSLSFDGVDDYISFANSVIPTTGDVSVQVWAYAEQNNGYSNIIAQGDPTNGAYFVSYESDNQMRISHEWSNIDVAYPFGEWVQITVVKNDGGTKLYFDSQLAAETTSTMLPTDNPLFIGVQYNGNNEHWSGNIDEVRLWNIALSDAEIQSNYNAVLTGNESGLVGYWNFNDGEGSTLTDLSGNDNHGTINGATWSDDGAPVQPASFASLSVGTVDAVANSAVLVPIEVDLMGESISSVEIHFGGFQGHVDFVAVDTTETLVGDAEWNIEINEQEDLLITGTYGASEISTNGTLMRLKFEVPNNINTDFVPVVIIHAEMDENEGVIDVVDGGIEIESLLYGDVSQNNDVSLYDASLVLKYLIGTETLDETQLMVAEVTQDGTVSALDATAIAQYAIEIIDALPVADTQNLAGGGTLFINETMFQPGELLEVPVMLTNGNNLLSFEIDLSYESEAITLESIAWSDLIGHFTIEENYEAGSIKVAGLGTEPDGQEGVFATVSLFIASSFTDESFDVTINKYRINESDPIEDVVVTFTNSALGIDANTIPTVYALHQNYPNPFNPTTQVNYDLPETGSVQIMIYDLMGRKVRTLINSEQNAGFKTLQWNATNDRNEPVSAGLYLYTIQAGEFRQTKKMVLLK